MSHSRRNFMAWLAAATTLAIPGRSKGMSLFDGSSADGYQSSLMPTEKEVWDQLVWMARLGPKYTLIFSIRICGRAGWTWPE
jgi:hypothetical protein